MAWLGLSSTGHSVPVPSRSCVRSCMNTYSLVGKVTIDEQGGAEEQVARGGLLRSIERIAVVHDSRVRPSLFVFISTAPKDWCVLEWTLYCTFILSCKLSKHAQKKRKKAHPRIGMARAHLTLLFSPGSVDQIHPNKHKTKVSALARTPFLYFFQNKDILKLHKRRHHIVWAAVSSVQGD
jgi:hypothetical protein